MPQTATLYAAFAAKLDAVLETLTGEGVLPSDANRSAVTVEPPRDASHGDLSTNAAMVLAKQAKANPRALAEQIAAQLLQDPLVAQADIAGPGFINLRLEPLAWLNEIQAIAGLGADYGRSAMGAGSTVNVEYVSANPTGPMHMGHCRGAVVGDALASLLEYAGHKVIREYYVNDAGAQVQVLARSVHMRYREALGEDIGEIPEGLYPGAYLVPTGHRLATHYGSRFLNAPEAEWLDLFRTEAVVDMMAMIRADLALLGIAHDVFSSEAELQAAGKPEAAEQWLRQHDLVYDGMLEAPKGKTPEDWEPVELPLFRSTRFGDDQDRPIRKSDGNWTYFGADLAYHFQKEEKADALVDIWGADHAGTVKRIKAAVAALT
ncbi:MAG: arginine--tRNA ligase, partial [Novosphingobium sp.]|nr:arginine--tRNA ligase [Novosphingobium sp.]